MKVKCIANSKKYLSKKEGALGNSEEYTREYLEIDKIYIVYGIMLCKDVLSYLIYAESATFEPVDLFEVIDDKIPPMWHYAYFSKSASKKSGSPVQAMWGYPELVQDVNHNSDLSLRTDQAVNVFFKHKFEYDNWEEQERQPLLSDAKL